MPWTGTGKKTIALPGIASFGAFIRYLSTGLALRAVSAAARDLAPDSVALAARHEADACQRRYQTPSSLVMPIQSPAIKSPAIKSPALHSPALHSQQGLPHNRVLKSAGVRYYGGMQKPKLTFFDIWNMNFGFLGIQFGWGLQLANMTAIYTKLGASPEKIPILWIAGPITGLLIQPFIGAMSDRTWNRLGRRRPYFLAGALLSSAALLFMPDSPVLWVAATLLWILDASINISMEPFRAFVADKLPESQRTMGFIMQSFFIGIGATLANALPLLFHQMGLHGVAPNHVPITVNYSFKLGAIVFLLCVLWTVFSTSEYPPEDIDAFHRERASHGGFGGLIGTIIRRSSPPSKKCRAQ